MIRSSSMRLRIAASPPIYRDGSARIRRFGSLKALSTAERSKEIAVGREGECNEHTRPAVPPPTSIRPRSGRIVSPMDNVRRRRCRARRRVAFHSEDNATAPRSARSGWMYRGSREGSLRSPPCDPRLFPSTAPRSFTRPYSSRPRRGRRALGGGTAGRAMARCARPRATHGYFLRPLRGRLSLSRSGFVPPGRQTSGRHGSDCGFPVRV